MVTKQKPAGTKLTHSQRDQQQQPAVNNKASQGKVFLRPVCVLFMLSEVYCLLGGINEHELCCFSEISTARHNTKCRFLCNWLIMYAENVSNNIEWYNSHILKCSYMNSLQSVMCYTITYPSSQSATKLNLWKHRWLNPLKCHVSVSEGACTLKWTPLIFSKLQWGLPSCHQRTLASEKCLNSWICQWKDTLSLLTDYSCGNEYYFWSLHQVL